MSTTRARLDALAFVYHVIHSLDARGKQWLRSLTPGQAQDVADVVVLWERTRHPSCDSVAHSEIVPLHEVEKRAILNAVEKLGAPLKAAAALGIGKTTLYRKLKEYASEPLKILPQPASRTSPENVSSCIG